MGARTMFMSCTSSLVNVWERSKRATRAGYGRKQQAVDEKDHHAARGKKPDEKLHQWASTCMKVLKTTTYLES